MLPEILELDGRLSDSTENERHTQRRLSSTFPNQKTFQNDFLKLFGTHVKDDARLGLRES